jgi:hypothetical protein
VAEQPLLAALDLHALAIVGQYAYFADNPLLCIDNTGIRAAAVSGLTYDDRNGTCP